ncbi:hypothetical protein KY284_010067 [Solanum tuberosum]|nr:hypothetical protein KY284_010067 [Solanum tuberosum]
MSVDDYFKAMDMAMIQANCNEDEEATMARFLNGLNGEIVDVVELQQYVNLDELVELAVKGEKQNKRKQQASSWKNRSTTTTRKPWSTDEEKSMPKSQDDRGKGKWEAKDGGKTFNTKISIPSTPSSAIQCHKRQGRGHKAFECPNRRVVLIKDNGKYESEKSEGEEEEGVRGEDERDVAPHNEGQFLGIVRRLMNINMGELDEALRENMGLKVEFAL